MEKYNRKVIGHPDGLQIEISWDDVHAKMNHTAHEATSGSLSLWIGEELIWGIENENNSIIPVKWTWIELLEFLSDSWSYIAYEETYPINGIKPQYPSELREMATRRWQNMPEDISIKEEKEIYYFESSHDLSRGLKGILLPSVFIMREGNYMWIETSELRINSPFKETINTLEEIGNFICERIRNIEDPHAEWVYSRWNKRKNIGNEELLSVITKLSLQDIKDIQGDKSFNSAWETDNINPFELTELQVAARMIGSISGKKNIQSVLDEIRKIGHSEIPELDNLSEKALMYLNKNGKKEFFEQGYILANWLRKQTDIVSDGGKVEPKKLLTDWGVFVQEIEINEPSIDAVACWGPIHGPAILLNKKGIHNKKISGKLSTYAHEICHLLVDRQGFLPLVEVFGGHSPIGAERRANAFAAELLLPRSVAFQYIIEKQGEEIKNICSSLSAKYKVSFHLIANQILNSDVPLSKEYYNYLSQIRVLHDM